MTVAVVGGAAIGLAGTVYASNKASSAAKKAGKRADAADARRFAYEEERRAEWEETYGGVEDRLSAYYETLSPTLKIAQGLENFEKEKAVSMKNFSEGMAQRNVDRSGMVAQLENDVAIGSAEARAKIRAEAPMEVAKEQASFLQVGLNQNPDQGMRTALSGEQTRSASLERTTAANAGEATGAVIDAATVLAQAGLDKYADYRAKRKPANPEIEG
jgi:hypothetical protein